MLAINIRSPRFRARRRYKQLGFSLAECAVALLVTSVVIIGALKAVAMTQRVRLQAQSQRNGMELASGLMTEVVQAAYIDPGASPTFGPESGESGRTTWNDIDDYASYSESPPADKTGNPLTGYAGWTRTVAVAWVDPLNPTGSPTSSDTGLKRITVTATDPSSKSVALVGFRSSKGLGEELRPVVNETCITWAGATITGANGASGTTGVSLINDAN